MKKSTWTNGKSYYSERTTKRNIALDTLVENHAICMKASLKDVNISSKSTLHSIVDEAISNPVKGLKSKAIQLVAAPAYNKDSYTDQKIWVGFNKDKLVIGSNRPGTSPKEVKFAKPSAENLLYFIRTYRNDNDLKCARFSYENINNGKTATNCNKFVEECYNWLVTSARA